MCISTLIFTDVYLSLNDVIIPNNSYVAINDIGTNTYSSALICHTDRPAVHGKSGGDWYSPEGDRVSGYFETATVQGFVRSRGPMRAYLYKRYSSSSPPEGIYHCTIQDKMNKKHKIYVGIYDRKSRAGESQQYRLQQLNIPYRNYL